MTKRDGERTRWTDEMLDELADSVSEIKESVSELRESVSDIKDNFMMNNIIIQSANGESSN